MAENATIPSNIDAVHLRPPAEREVRACRMLIPSAFVACAPTVATLAVTESPRKFHGAAAGTFVMVDGKPDWRGWLHVVPGSRKQGIGARLLASVVEQGRRHGAGSVTFRINPTEDSSSIEFLPHHGFSTSRSVLTYEAALEKFVDICLPLKERAYRRGRIPGNARFVNIAEAPARQIIQLYRRYIGQIPLPRDPNTIRATKDAFDNPCSVALMVEDKVEAIMLVRLFDDVCKVEARIVTDKYQGGWANAVMMATGLENALRLNKKRVSFSGTDALKDTVKLAARSQAKVVARTDFYSLSLNS